MFPIRTILHPTDFSTYSDNAFRLASALARDHGSRLIVLHVSTPLVVAYGDMILPAAKVDYKQLKDKLLALAGPEPVRVEHLLEEGEPVPEILRVARETNCDLIVMGTHGRRGVGRLLMGSVAEQVMRQAPCPVVTVKTPIPQTAPTAAAEELVQI
jgi:nucleotide-binding universal stress UspA family protein